eukprot:TRINITY_DN2467_c0_g1_i1.p1 TRINITY_DN2467_c0_g1~~TRINITY_DN2467_c0_g1_i1.p1  ORF type:complete len:213 (+),score=56.52 TRINITY_DN2467_c0_g1_i1:38-676(+)
MPLINNFSENSAFDEQSLFDDYFTRIKKEKQIENITMEINILEKERKEHSVALKERYKKILNNKAKSIQIIEKNRETLTPLAYTNFLSPQQIHEETVRRSNSRNHAGDVYSTPNLIETPKSSTFITDFSETVDDMHMNRKNRNVRLKKIKDSAQHAQKNKDNLNSHSPPILTIKQSSKNVFGIESTQQGTEKTKIFAVTTDRIVEDFGGSYS